MHHSGHAKFHKKFKKSISNWWYVGAVVALTVIANFIGLVVFLGLSTTENETTTLPTETRTYRISSRHRPETTGREKGVLEAHVEEILREGSGNQSEMAESLVGDETQSVLEEETERVTAEDVFIEDNGLSELRLSSSSEDVTLIPEAEAATTGVATQAPTTQRTRMTTTQRLRTTTTQRARTTMTLEMPSTTPTPYNNHRFEKRLMQVDGDVQAFKPLYDERNEVLSLSRQEDYLLEDRENGALAPVEAADLYPYHPMRYDNEDPESGTNPLSAFFQAGLQDVYDWLSSEGSQSTSSNTSDFREVLRAVNTSIMEGNSSILLAKLREMYHAGEGETAVNLTLGNSTSLVSVGLLAFDLLLLYNVQQIAWEDHETTRLAMLRDPEVIAMNSLFLSPAQIREMQRPEDRKDQGVSKGFLEEALSFLNSAMRAVLALSRAYRTSREQDGTTPWNTLDCVWTIYCRNLDKTARLPGLYGFLAKMNSLGLRLVMGDFPVEHALDILISELMRGTSGINCERIFPKCSNVKNAVDVVLRRAIGIAGETL